MGNIISCAKQDSKDKQNLLHFSKGAIIFHATEVEKKHLQADIDDPKTYIQVTGATSNPKFVMVPFMEVGDVEVITVIATAKPDEDHFNILAAIKLPRYDCDHQLDVNLEISFVSTNVQTGMMTPIYYKQTRFRYIPLEPMENMQYATETVE